MKIYFDKVMHEIKDDLIFSQEKKVIVNTGEKFSTGNLPIIQPSETGEAIDKLNDDTLDKETGMSHIDLNSRLHGIEITANMVIDNLVAMHVLPRQCLTLTRQKKRLAVSEGGKGRQEIVEIARGLKEEKSPTGILGRVKNFFTGG